MFIVGCFAHHLYVRDRLQNGGEPWEQRYAETRLGEILHVVSNWRQIEQVPITLCSAAAPP